MYDKLGVVPTGQWMLRSEKEIVLTFALLPKAIVRYFLRSIQTNPTLNFFRGWMINSPVDPAGYRRVLWLNVPSDGITNWSILKGLALKVPKDAV